MSINSLDINPKVTQKLIAAGISHVKDVLFYSAYALEKKASLSKAEVAEILTLAARKCLQKCSFQLARDFQKDVLTLSTGCREMDKCLHGGILFPGITDVCGESGSGKTQLCMQISLQVLTSKEQFVLYVCTEDAFPVKRLQQMVIGHCKKFPANNPKELTDRMFIEHASDIDDLITLMDKKLCSLFSHFNVKLVVIDSIAALFRGQFTCMAERARCLGNIGVKLHRLSHQHKLCVVCVNQVTDDFHPVNGSTNIDGSRKVVPSLGMTWSHLVTSRILLSRTEWTVQKRSEDDQKRQPSEQNVRSFKILLAPHLPQSTLCYFTVDADGVQDCRAI